MAKDNEAISEFDKLSPAQEAIALKIHTEATAAGIDPELALATAWQENRFRPQGKSSAGALGPMQVMPSTAKLYGVKLKDLTNPDVNIKLGVQILKENLDRYEGNKELALIAYNAGPTVADRYMEKSDPKVLPKETQNYLKGISQYHDLSTQPNATVTSEEVSPFDEVPQTQDDDGDNPFGATDPLPDFLKNELTVTPRQPSMMEEAISYLKNNPEVPIAGVADALGQSMVNRRMEESELKQNLNRAQNKIVNLEEQFKAAQGAPQQPAQPNMDRVLQGRTEEGLTGRSRQSYNDITAARAAQARQQEEVLADLARKGLISPDYKPKILAQSMPTESTPSGVIYSGQRLRDEERPILEQQRRMIEEAERNKPALQRVRESIRPKVISPLEKVGRFGTKPFLGPLSTGVMAANTVREYEKANELEAQGDLLGSKIARFNAYANGLGAIPASPYMPLNVIKGLGTIGAGGGALLELARNYLFPYKSVTETPPK